MKRIRLLDLLAGRYPDAQREHLRARILCGEVLVGSERVRDPLRKVPDDAAVSFRDPGFVSRGGEKLEHALSGWNVPVVGRVFLDAGASSGGFTDALLRRGARSVHAVEVGYNQLDYRLRIDPRVTVRERTNIMDLRSLEPRPDAAVADLSFRSVAGAASRILDLTCERWLIALVKPQFEWQDPSPSFSGVVKDVNDLSAILRDLLRRLGDEGVLVRRGMESPIRGAKGNREFLMLLTDHRSSGIAWLPGGLLGETDMTDLAERGRTG